MEKGRGRRCQQRILQGKEEGGGGGVADERVSCAKRKVIGTLEGRVCGQGDDGGVCVRPVVRKFKRWNSW